jgi:hypothetical protein
MIANEFDKGTDKDSLLEKIDLTRKQFYLRISSLLNTGLINRILGRYCITSFGKINYEIQLLLGMAVDIHIAHRKLKRYLCPRGRKYSIRRTQRMQMR